jgi:hypothetical protein
LRELVARFMFHALANGNDTFKRRNRQPFYDLAADFWLVCY